MTFPGGTHDLWIRYWLAAGGIDPDKDVETIVVPPPQMVANMKVGTMDCFCVGEPWNEQLVNQKIGYTALTTGELWNEASREVLRHARRLGRQASQRHEGAAHGRAGSADVVRRHGQQGEGRAEIVGKRAWFNVPTKDIVDRLKGKFDYGTGRVVEDSPHFMKFWRDHASYPFQSHELWFLTEDVRWGKFEPEPTSRR